MPASAARVLAAASASSDRRPALDDHRAVGRQASTLVIEAPVGHEDLARHAEVAGRERQRLGVVAGAAGRDAVAALRAERGELVHRPADLERPGALQALGLEHDLPAGLLGERRRRDDRRARRRRSRHRRAARMSSSVTDRARAPPHRHPSVWCIECFGAAHPATLDA